MIVALAVGYMAVAALCSWYASTLDDRDEEFKPHQVTIINVAAGLLWPFALLVGIGLHFGWVKPR